jgi:membrane associated rhomboid family serine protease
MIEDREYMRRSPTGVQWSPTIVLLVINATVWVCQLLAFRAGKTDFFDDYLALSLDGLKSGRVWQLLTFQFLHAVPMPWHLLLNSWAIFLFGRIVERSLGKWRMLRLYFLSGVMGGLVQMLCTWILPAHFGDAPIVGASAGASGLLAAFAVLLPNQRMVMLVYFIPVVVRAKTLLWLVMGLSVFGMIHPYGNIGHAAHLGGILTGFLFARLVMRGYRVPPVYPGPGSTMKITPAQD